MIKIDLGCGKNKREGFLGVDSIDFEGVDVVLNVGKDPWPWEDGSVDEVHASHFVEHLEPEERIHFVNELFRVLNNPVWENGQLVSGKCTIIVPHWASQRAYGDLTHKWPPVSEFWFLYLDDDWRKVNAPHNQDYKCNFFYSIGYNLNPNITVRNQEYQQFAMQWYKEACSDLYATLWKKG